jgi:nucleotide-binding universal stress UspA family protein
VNILVGQDGSDVSLHAIGSVIDLAARLREPPQVHLVFVHPPIPLDFATKHIDQAALDAYYREEGEQALAAASDLLAAARIAVTRHIHVGVAAPTIVKLAGELDCQLICLGTHGRGALSTALLGSVAGKVVHLSTLPVMLVRQSSKSTP